MFCNDQMQDFGCYVAFNLMFAFFFCSD